MLRACLKKSFESGLFTMNNQSDLERREKLFDKEAENAIINWCKEKQKNWNKLDKNLKEKEFMFKK